MSNNDFTNEELKLISDTVAERLGGPVETQQVDIELRVHEVEYKVFVQYSPR